MFVWDSKRALADTDFLSNFMNPTTPRLSLAVSWLRLSIKIWFLQLLQHHTHTPRQTRAACRASIVLVVPVLCVWAREKGAENKFILQIEQISEKIIRLKQIDSIPFFT